MLQVHIHMQYVTFTIITICLTVGIIPSIYAESVPDWVKNTAGWWAEDAISETEFVNAIQFLVNQGMIQVTASDSSKTSQNTPDWVKNTAGWWAEDAISETEFVNAIQFLVNQGIILVDNECKFNMNTYRLLSEKDVWFLCNLNFDYLSDWAESKYSKSEIELNSEGFRGVEFSQMKEDNTIRIFAVGGSTTFGNGVSDENTYPVILQKKINSLNLEKNIEIINAGYGGAWSKTETNLIKDKLIQYEPDIFIIYDGWNEIQNEVYNKNNNEQEWKNRWIDICKLGNEKGFETIILLQPTIGTISMDKRIPVDQEIIIWNIRSLEHQQLTQAYIKYSNMIPELEQNCSHAANLQNIFDEVYGAVFFDYGHTNTLGNEIIAQNVLKEIQPILIKNFNINLIIKDEIPGTISQELIPKELDFRGNLIKDESFNNQDLKNANFQYALIENTDFSNADLEGADFRFATIKNSAFIDSNLKNSMFARAEIKFTDFSRANLENSYIGVSNIENTDFSKTRMIDSKIFGTTIVDSIFLNSDMQNSFLHQSYLINSNIFDGDYKNVTLSHTFLTNCNAANKDLSQIILEYKNIFVNCNFNKSILPTQLNDLDFSTKRHATYGVLEGSSLSEVDFTKIDLTKAIFSTNYKLSEVESENINFMHQYGVNLSFSDFKNMNLSEQNFSLSNLSNSKFNGADMSFSDLRFSNLEGANLEGANLEGANLEGANLEGANLNCMNHEICN